jgi:serine/threonine protein kinase
VAGDSYRNALPLQSMLQEYRLEAVLGAGGFGLTYLARDTHLEKHVAIKEYLPTDLVVRALDGSIMPITGELQREYEWGLERFILEARTLAKFSHPHIVRVNRFFQANGTGYMVMDYEKGESLHQMLKRGQKPDEAGLKGILMPLLDGLQAVHATGFLHRDIKPSNIFVRESGSPVLIDFGAARHAIGATRSLTSVLTPGYAPLEQYSSDGHQGPWSDIYAMAGVIYRVLVDENPPDAVSRMKSDSLPAKLARARGRVSEPFLRAVEWGLALDEQQRPQSVQEWGRALKGQATAPSAAQIALQSAPTVVSAPTPPKPPASQPSGPPARPGSGKSGSPWRWVGIAAILLVAVLAFSAWNKQRVARKAASEPAASSKMQAPAPRPKPAAAQSPFDLPRERPARERDDRPGGEQRPGAGEFRVRVLKEFRSADRNDDGYLSRDEAQARFAGIAREFERVDADGDGRISPEEFLRLRRFQAQQKFKKN